MVDEHLDLFADLVAGGSPARAPDRREAISAA